MRAPVRTSKGSRIKSRSRCSAWLAAGCDSPIRIAARLTLASLSSASSAISRLRSSELKFMRRIYIIFIIDWKNVARAEMIGGEPINGETLHECHSQQKTDGRDICRRRQFRSRSARPRAVHREPGGRRQMGGDRAIFVVAHL